MTVHTELTRAEAADRLALRELFDVYAHCADRRDAEGKRRSSPRTPASSATAIAAELRGVPGGSRGRVDCPSGSLRPAFPSALASSGAA
jgi:hypothetical protein